MSAWKLHYISKWFARKIIHEIHCKWKWRVAKKILFTSMVIPARKQNMFPEKKQMEYQKASPEPRQVWSSGKTLLDLPWSNGNDQWPMAIFGHAQHAMVLHLCRAKCSLIQVFVTCGSSYRCLYRFTYAKIPTLPVIWEKTCFVSSTFVPIRKIIENASSEKHRKRHAVFTHFTCTFFGFDNFTLVANLLA